MRIGFRASVIPPARRRGNGPAIVNGRGVAVTDWKLWPQADRRLTAPKLPDSNAPHVGRGCLDPRSVRATAAGPSTSQVIGGIDPHTRNPCYLKGHAPARPEMA